MFEFLQSFRRKVHYIMIPVTLSKEYLLNGEDNHTTIVIESMLEKAKEPDPKVLKDLALGDGAVATARDFARKSFDDLVGYEAREINEWRDDFTRHLVQAQTDRDEHKKERDKLEKTVADAADKIMPLSVLEKVELAIFSLLGVSLWLVGYFSLVALIINLDSPLKGFVAYLIPFAGVTALAIGMESFLSLFKGTKFYKTLLVFSMALGILAALAWLVLFSDFIEGNSRPIALLSLDAAPVAEVKSHGNNLYIIASVLAEALAVSSAWSSIFRIIHGKTVRVHTVNPLWKHFDDLMNADNAECHLWERRIALCESLMHKIDSAREVFITKAEATFMRLKAGR